MFNKRTPFRQYAKGIKQPPTEGENRLLKILDATLKKDEIFPKDGGPAKYKGCLIFVQPFLNANRPDVI